MIEKVYRKARKRAASLKAIRPGPAVFIIVLVLAFARGGWSFYQRHADHREEIANAIGSIGYIYGTPQIDATESRIIYFQNSEDGLGIFASDMDGKKQTLFDWPGIHSADRMHDKISLSPDDALFAYAVNADSRAPSGYLAICEASAGKELARLDTPESMDGIVWLSPEELVWLGNNERAPREPYHLHVIQKQSKGTWNEFVPGVRLSNVSSLIGLSSNAVAWVDSGGLRAMNTDSQSITTLYAPPSGQISECRYLPVPGEWLMTCKESNTFSLWRLKAGPKGVTERRHLETAENIQSAQWVNGGKGYAYLDNKALVVRLKVESPPIRLADASVDAFVAEPNGHGLFLLGARENDPWAGLWRYDLADQSLKILVPYSDEPSASAIPILPIHGVAHLKSETGNYYLNYYVYRPVHFNRHKKYPLLIGDTTFQSPNPEYQNSPRGPAWALAMAECGAYVVIVDRYNWFWGIQEWDRHVMDVYRQLLPDPTIDARQVYLYAASAETAYMARLIEEKPELWKGALFLNPSGLPNLHAMDSSKKFPKILLNAGADEAETERFNDFQKEASKLGMEVEFQELPKTGHFLISKLAARERIRAMADFVFNH